MKIKKNILITIVVLLGFGIVLYYSFSKEEDKEKNMDMPKIYLSDGEVSIRKNEKVVLDDLVISLIDVKDSRCPKNVECFWEGELNYSLLINNENYEISTVLKKEIEYNNYLIDIVADKCNNNEVVLIIEGEE